VPRMVPDAFRQPFAARNAARARSRPSTMPTTGRG
jgi:hypothetical protein